jgi:hypothetical protein
MALRDAQGDEFAFQSDPAASAEVAGEDRAVVGEQTFGAAVACGGAGQQPRVVVAPLVDCHNLITPLC